MDLTGELQDAAGRDLVAEVARQFGEVRLQVIGISMIPSLWPGDVLIVRSHSIAELSPGQVVQFISDGRLVCHRVVRNCGDRLITRGDSARRFDPPVYEAAILGRVVSILRDGRSVDPSPAWWHGSASWILQHSELCTRMLIRLRRLACPS